MVTLPSNWSDWELTGELGRGSYSFVYEAVRKDQPSVRCAIKVISIPQDESELDELRAEGFTQQMSASFFEEAVRDFTREIGLMERFKGMQNIVSIEDFKVIPRENGIGSEIFIRMELLTSLEKYISDKVLTEDEVIRIGVDICTALEFCQEQGIIHRDIKPANIFVNDRIGTHVFYKLGDFGIARNLENRSQGMSAKGTPNYMAPEVALNMPYDTRADLYSLGLTLYWLLNGNRLPFYPQTQLYSPAAKREALQRRMAGDPMNPPVKASESAAEVILKACAFRQEDRYQSAAEMKRALTKLLTAPEEDAFSERNPAGASAPGNVPARRETPSGNGTAEKTEKKSRRWVIPAVTAAILVLAGGGYILSHERPVLQEIPPAVTEPAVPGRGEGTETAGPTEITGFTEAPDSTAEAEAANQITMLFRRLGEKSGEIASWESRITEDQVILPLHWASLPFAGGIGEAPKASVSVSGGRLRIVFTDVPSHERTVEAVLGLRRLKLVWQEEEGACTCELPDGIDPEGMTVTVSYQEGEMAAAFVYDSTGTLSDEAVPLACKSALIKLTGEKGTLEALSSADGSCRYDVQACRHRISAHYTAGELTQYEDQAAGCSYDRDGFIISGELNRAYLSPVILSESGGEEPESAQRAVLKKMQAMRPGAEAVFEYCEAGHIYIPEFWSELPGSDITLEDAPGLTIRREGETAVLVLPENERKWTVDPDSSEGIRQEGEAFLLDPDTDCTAAILLDTLQEEKKSGDRGIRCSVIYSLGRDGTVQPILIETSFYTVESWTVSNQGSESRPLILPRLSMRDMLDFNNRTEWLDFFYTAYNSAPGTEANTRQIIGSYQRSLGCTDGRLSGQTVRGMDDLGWQEYYLSYPKAPGSRAISCVRLNDDTVLRIERSISRDSSVDSRAYPLRDLCGSTHELEITEQTEAEEVCGVGGDWRIRKMVNRSDHTLALAKADAEEQSAKEYAWCVPGVIPPGETAWIISEGDEMPELLFVRDDSLTVLRMETESREDIPAGETEEGEEKENTVRQLAVRNPHGEDVFFLDWLIFLRDSDGNVMAELNEVQRDNADYMIPAEGTVIISLEEKGDETAYAWGYPGK